MSRQESAWSRLVAQCWVNSILPVLGLLLPPLFLLLYPWPMVGQRFYSLFCGMSLVAGKLLRTWWGTLIAPIVTLVTILGYSSFVRSGASVTGDEFTIGGVLVVAGVLLFLMALGVLIGRRILVGGERF